MKRNLLGKLTLALATCGFGAISGGVLASNFVSVNSNDQTALVASQVKAEGISLDAWTYDVNSHRLEATNYQDYYFDVTDADPSFHEIKLLKFHSPNDATVFYNITNLDKITSKATNPVAYQVIAIGDRCFQDQSNLLTITLPDEVTRLQDHTFENCTNLTEIHTSLALSRIDKLCFKQCAQLKWFNATSESNPGGLINLPNAITIISEECFSGCSSIVYLNLPSYLQIIDNLAFYNCSNLISVDLPEGVSEIGLTVFGECNKLAEINVPQEDPAEITLEAHGLFEPGQGGTDDYLIYVPTIDAVSLFEEATGWKVHKGHYRVSNDSDESVRLVGDYNTYLKGIEGTAGSYQYYAEVRPTDKYVQAFEWSIVEFIPDNWELRNEVNIDQNGELTWSDELPAGKYYFNIKIVATEYADIMAPHKSKQITLDILKPDDLKTIYTTMTMVFVAVPIGSAIVALITYLVYRYKGINSKWWSKP